MYLDFQQIVLSQCCSLCTMQCVATCTTVPGWQQVATKTEQDCCSILFYMLGVRFIRPTGKAPMTTSTNRCPFSQELASRGLSIEVGTQHAASCRYQSFNNSRITYKNIGLLTYSVYIVVQNGFGYLCFKF